MADDDAKGKNADTLPEFVGGRALDPARDDLPVVARLVVEIRSDGTRTVARGAMEDVATGQKVAVEARGTTPMRLAMSMARSMFKAPMLARTAARALLKGRTSDK